jgi:hypothetical protein
MHCTSAKNDETEGCAVVHPQWPATHSASVQAFQALLRRGTALQLQWRPGIILLTLVRRDALCTCF